MIIVSGRNRGLRFPVYNINAYTRIGASPGDSIVPVVTAAGRDIVLAAAGMVFHSAIFIAPLTAGAHWILFDQAWSVFPPRIAPEITRLFTIAAIAAGIFLVLRRTLMRHVFAVSSWRDYAAMCCVLTPFVTGLLAGELVGPYETVMVIHCVSAHILLLAIGWTRLGHMVFFASGRFLTLGFPKGTNSWIL